MRVKDRFKKAFHKVRSAVYSRKGVISLGIASAVLTALMLVLILVPSIDALHWENNSCESTLVLRRKAFQEGVDAVPQSINGQLWSNHAKALEYKNEEKRYTYAVVNNPRGANFFEVNQYKDGADHSYVASVSLPYFLRELNSITHEFLFDVDIRLYRSDYTDYKDAEGRPYELYAYYYLSDKLVLTKRAPFKAPQGSTFTPEQIDLFNAEADALAEEMGKGFVPLLSAFGAPDAQQIIDTSYDTVIAQSNYLYLPIFTVPLALINGPILCLFIAVWIRLLEKDKAKKLVASGEMTAEEVHNPELIQASKDIDELPTRTNAIRELTIRYNLRPVLGEWFFRGFGLVLVAIGILLTHFIDTGTAAKWGTFGSFLIANESAISGIASTGRFILVIAVIGIIAETRKNLRFNAAAFFTLAVTFYLLLCSVFYVVDIAYPYEFINGFRFTDILAAAIPGNIFFSLGIYAFLGYFLFENPPKWFISRPLFRSLCVLPIGLAVVSVIHSVLRRGGVFIPSYWVSNLLFVRDFDTLVLGILYELSIFAFRTKLKRVYGEKNIATVMARPDIQFWKNLSLCGLIVLYVIAFYVVPVSVKGLLNLPTQTYIYFLIPFFLFYKPAGKDHSATSDIIYYILYLLAMGIPSISQMLFSL